MTPAAVTADEVAPFLKLSNHTIGEHLGDRHRARVLAETVYSEASFGDSQAFIHLAVARYLDGDQVAAQTTEIEAVGEGPSDEALANYIQLKAILAAAMVGSQQFDDGTQRARPKDQPSVLGRLRVNRNWLDRYLSLALANTGSRRFLAY